MLHQQRDIKVYVEAGQSFSSPIAYIWRIFSHNKKIQFSFINNKSESDVIIDSSQESNFPVHVQFYKDIALGKFDHSNYFKSDCLIQSLYGQPDYLASCFYMINSMQEFSSKEVDEMNRFKYEASYQHKFDNIRINLVQKYFDLLFDKLQDLNIISSPKKSRDSKIFLSHDVDSVYGALIQDGFTAIKNGDIGSLFRLFFQSATGRPSWLNMDKIMKMESEYDFISTFYWIVNKGKFAEGIMNADYTTQEPRIKRMIKEVAENGFENGLHKSVSHESFNTEILKAGFPVFTNRYHYLKINLPNSFNEIEQSGVKVDSSLGFAEHYGFRNSYGLPFQPYDFKNQQSYSFVEVPMIVMDRTFFSYLHTPVDSVAKTIINFFEKNNSNTVFSLLWHNNFFESIKYRGYTEEYKKILSFLYERKFTTTNAREMYTDYFISI